MHDKLDKLADMIHKRILAQTLLWTVLTALVLFFFVSVYGCAENPRMTEDSIEECEYIEWHDYLIRICE